MSLDYLLASLPGLTLGQPPPFASEDFIELCNEQTSMELGAAVDALLKEKPHCHPFVVEWVDKETILRNAVAAKRSTRLGADPAQWQRATIGCDLRITAAVDNAFAMANPLDRELALDKLRWAVAEELRGPDLFNEKTLLVYAIHLRLTERWHKLKKELARERAALLTDVAIEIAE